MTENGTSNLSFHRFNISVSGYRFELTTGDTPKCALFFIGKFQGDDAAKKYLTSLGFTLKDIDDTSESFSHQVSDAKTDEFIYIDDSGAYLFEAYLKKEINKNDPNTYTKQFSATAKATFGSSGDPKDNSLSSEERRLSFQKALWDALSAPDME